MSNWVTNLDMLADAGVIDYDAPSFINGTPARYAGSPEFALKGFDASQLPEPLKQDEFKKSENPNFVNNPAWKTVLFTLLAVGGIALGGYKFRAKLMPALKKFPSKTWDAIKTPFKSLKDLPSKTWKKLEKPLGDAKEFFVKQWENITGFFKSA